MREPASGAHASRDPCSTFKFRFTYYPLQPTRTRTFRRRNGFRSVVSGTVHRHYVCVDMFNAITPSPLVHDSKTIHSSLPFFSKLAASLSLLRPSTHRDAKTQQEVLHHQFPRSAGALSVVSEEVDHSAKLDKTRQDAKFPGHLQSSTVPFGDIFDCTKTVQSYVLPLLHSLFRTFSRLRSCPHTVTAYLSLSRLENAQAIGL